MTRKQLLGVFGIEVFLAVIFLVFRPSIPCFFKSILSIPCPGCGLTRAFYAFMKGNIIEAFSYNILFYPILGFHIYLFIRLLISFRRGEKKILFLFLKRPLMLWIVGFLLVCSEIYNLINGI